MIPEYGFVAAAYTTLVSNALLILMHYIFYRNCQKERVYNDRIFALISVVTIIACEVCVVLYINTVIRYIFILLLFLIFLYFSKKIFKLIRNIKID